MESTHLNQEEIEAWHQRIDTMSQTDMARLWRYAPVGHPCFNRTLALYEHFERKFKGFTPTISKTIDRE